MRYTERVGRIDLPRALHVRVVAEDQIFLEWRSEPWMEQLVYGGRVPSGQRSFELIPSCAESSASEKVTHELEAGDLPGLGRTDGYGYKRQPPVRLPHCHSRARTS